MVRSHSLYTLLTCGRHFEFVTVDAHSFYYSAVVAVERTVSAVQ